MADAVKAVRAALEGKSMDVDVLEQLAFFPEMAQTVRGELVPLFIELLTKFPKTASQVPVNLIETLFRDLNMDEILQLTGLDSSSLDNALVRPLILSQMVLKANTGPLDPTALAMVEKAMNLYADPELDGSSVSQIENLVACMPGLAIKYLPLHSMFTGCAILKSRFMDINIILLKNKISLDSSLVIWSGLVSEDEDIILAALQIDYVGRLMSFFIKHTEIQQSVRHSLYNLCQKYSTETLLSNSIENVLIQCSNHVPSLFFELDAQFLLINGSRTFLLANIPASYIVKHHLSVVDELELRNATLEAIANIATDYVGLQRLSLSLSKLSQLPVPSQVKIAASATITKDGANLFKSQFESILRNAIDAPVTQEMRPDKERLAANLKEWGIRMIGAPSVATLSA